MLEELPVFTGQASREGYVIVGLFYLADLKWGITIKHVPNNYPLIATVTECA